MHKRCEVIKGSDRASAIGYYPFPARLRCPLSSPATSHAQLCHQLPMQLADPATALQRFQATCEAAGEAQRRVLQDVVALNCNADLLRQHGLATAGGRPAAADAEALLSQLPLTTYGDYRPAVEAALEVGDMPATPTPAVPLLVCWWLLARPTPPPPTVYGRMYMRRPTPPAAGGGAGGRGGLCRRRRPPAGPTANHVLLHLRHHGGDQEHPSAHAAHCGIQPGDWRGKLRRPTLPSHSCSHAGSSHVDDAAGR